MIRSSNFKENIAAMGKISLALVLLIFCSLTIYGQEKKKPTAAYYFEKGEKSLEKKEFITAQAHFTECLRLDPYYAEAYRARAIVRERLGEKAKALTDYNIYVDLKPADVEAIFSRAVLRFDGGQFLPARQDFLQLLTMPTGETNTVYFSQEKYSDGDAKIFTAQGSGKDYIYNYLGLIDIKLKRYDKAIVWLDSAIKLAPGNANYWINRGTARMDNVEKAAAATDFEQALRLEPESSLALHNLATLKSAAGENVSSEKLLSEAIEKNKNLPYPRAERAYQRLQSNDLKGALEDYDEVIRMEPKDEENYINRGLVKEKMKDLPGALKDFSTAIELDEKNEKAWLSRGNIMSKLSRPKEAIEDYGIAIALASDYPLAYYNRGIAYQNTGMKKESCADLMKAEKLGVKVDVKVKEKSCK